MTCTPPVLADETEMAAIAGGILLPRSRDEGALTADDIARHRGVLPPGSVSLEDETPDEVRIRAARKDYRQAGYKNRAGCLRR